MDTSEYFLLHEQRDGTYVCETLDGRIVLAAERSEQLHFFREENGYPLDEEKLALLDDHNIPEVHIHVKETDEVLRFDAKSYLDAKPTSLGVGSPVSTVSIDEAR
jgi:hypothetical protein